MVLRMRNTHRNLAAALSFTLLGVLASCGGEAPPPPTVPPPPLPGTTVMTIDLGVDGPNWTAGFADYGFGREADVGFIAETRALPAPLAGQGLYHAGVNISDDLFMYFAREVDGLAPDTDYELSFQTELASFYGADCDVGVAASTSLVAGATTAKPERVLVDEPSLGSYYRMNFDGVFPIGRLETLAYIDDIRNDLPGCFPGTQTYALGLTTGTGTIVATTDADGRLWLILGTDSAWESWYEVYFKTLSVTVTEI
jgi:hypothetical protein